MPTDKDGKSVETTEQYGRVNHYGAGWGGSRNSEMKGKLSAKEEKKAEKTFVHVRSYIENLVSRGHHRPK